MSNVQPQDTKEPCVVNQTPLEEEKALVPTRPASTANLETIHARVELLADVAVDQQGVEAEIRLAAKTRLSVSAFLQAIPVVSPIATRLIEWYKERKGG